MESPAIELALQTIKIGKQAIIFANTKRSAEKLAEDISKKIKENKEEWNAVSLEVKKVLSRPTRQCERLSLCLSKGIAFHHAGLNYKQKDIIEDNFKLKNVNIICSTPTLALGVSLPAYRVIMNSLKRYGYRGLTWIPTLEYLQMAGRAGRPEWDNHGEAIAIVKNELEKKEITERYILGEPEDIYSKLAVEPVLRTYLLSLIATGFVNSKKEIIDFFSKTFWAHQFKDMTQLEMIIEKMLGLLKEFSFIIDNKEKEDAEKSDISGTHALGFVSADEFTNDFNYRSTLLGKRVAELYIDPLTADYLIKAVKEGANKKLNELSLLQAVSHTLEMRPLLRVGVKEHDKIQEGLMEYSDGLLEVEPIVYDPDYEEFLKSIKTALFIKDWINEKDEEYLLENYNIRPGEIKAKLDRADWLLYSTYELTRILNEKEMLKEIMKMRLRIKHGVKEELLPLLKLKGIGRVRARKMFNNKIKDIKNVKDIGLGQLKLILGEKVALKVKEQVGQKNLNKIS